MRQKIITSLFLVLFIHQFSIANNYQEGDTLHVVAFSGLTLRSEPNVTSRKIGKLECKDDVIILNTFDFKENKDTIEGFTGNWIYVFGEDKTGYVFDAFISTLPVFDFTSTSFYKNDELNDEKILQVLPSLLLEYSFKMIGKEECEYFYQTPYKGTSYRDFRFYNLRHGHQLVEHGFWEGQSTELVLNHIRISEVYYLIKHLLKSIPSNQLIINDVKLKSQKNHLIYGDCIAKDSKNGDCYIQIYKQEKNKISIFFHFPCC